MKPRGLVIPFLAFAMLLGLIGPAAASEYRVSVSREDSELYRIVGQDILIKTWGCFEFAFAEDALLRMNGRTGTLVFLDEGAKCQVSAVYGKTTVPAGTYSVTLTRESQDWYSVLGMEMHIKTMACYEYWFGEDLTLKVDYDGSATLYKKSGGYEFVEGFYGPMNL